MNEYKCRMGDCLSEFESPVGRSLHEYKNHNKSEIEINENVERHRYTTSSHCHEDQCVYILRLSEDNYYVGISQEPESRIEQHRVGRGANWTQKHDVVEVVSISDPYEHETALEQERQETLRMMKQHGADSVRGSGWLTVELEDEPDLG